MHVMRARRLAAIVWTLAALAGCGGSSQPPPPQCTQAADCAALPNATPACVNGACTLGACDAGYADCDASASNGCEVNTGTSLGNCGACNQACAPANATGACNAGQCGIASCSGGFRDCDGSAANGCEVDTATSLAHCGACNQACAPANGAGACNAGQCGIASCSGELRDCDGSAANGCEADTATSLAHCGACNQACAPANASGVCTAGRCGIAACAPPYFDCDGNASNGCECLLLAGHPGITVFNQTVAAQDGEGVSFPGQANFWDLDGDFSLRDGGNRQLAGALVLKVGALEPTAQYFPGDQDFAELAFLLPEFGAPDGVRVAAASGAFDYLFAQPRTPIAGSYSAWLGSTSDSRLSQPVNLAGAVAPVTLTWTDAPYANIAAVLPGEDSYYRVVVRDAGGALLATALPAGSAPGFHAFDLSTFAGQRVTVSFELRGPALAMVAVDEVSVTAGGPNLIQNGGFESGDLTGWATNTPAEPQNVVSGARNLGGLRVTRTVYSPPSALWARWVDVYENLGATDVFTTAWYETALGSGGNGVTYLVDGTGGKAVSSWDTCSAAPACAPGTRDVGLAFGAATGVAFDSAPDLNAPHIGLSRYLTWNFPLVVLAGGRVALVHFVVMDGRDTGMTATAVSERAGAVDAQNLAIATGFWTEARYRAGMTPGQVAAVANWPRPCAQATDCQAIANGTPACIGGACAVGACDAGFADCNGLVGDGCETSLASDPLHCGTCGTLCPAVANGTRGCSSGVCGVGTCAGGFGDCDRLPGNGCETSLSIDLANCGACGAACAPAQATGFCAAGTCAIASCQAGFADCDGLPGTGCEANLATDVRNCGLCYLACSVPNGTPACAGGVCGLAACDAGFADCRNGAADGCETNTAVDPANCGACGRPCAYANASAACQSGACLLVACDPLHADCNGVAADGCEVPTASDLQHCGSCAPCPQLANATVGCTGGACVVASCIAPYQNCDGQAANGCESHPQTDPQNCGACGVSCPSGVCAAGVCQDRVLVVSASAVAGAADDVRGVLSATGAFAAVDLFDATAGTPTLAQLQGHQAVLVWSDAPFADPTALGDVLADYFEGGGRVVVAALANTTTTPGVALGGRFGNPATGYLLVAPAGADNVPDSILVVDGTSPLLAGVTTFSATVAWKSSGATANGGVAAATWQTTGFPLAVSGTVTLPGGSTRNRADLNLYPPSSAVDTLYWTGDGATLLRNALLFR